MAFTARPTMRAFLAAILAGQLAACATTVHEFDRSAIPLVARVASPAPGQRARADVRDREGNYVPFRPGTRMVLQLDDGSRRLEVPTRVRDLRVGPNGLWLHDDTFVPASVVQGFLAEDPHRGESIVAAILIPLLAVGAAGFLFFTFVGAPMGGGSDN